MSGRPGIGVAEYESSTSRSRAFKAPVQRLVRHAFEFSCRARPSDSHRNSTPNRENSRGTPSPPADCPPHLLARRDIRTVGGTRYSDGFRNAVSARTRPEHKMCSLKKPPISSVKPSIMPLVKQKNIANLLPESRAFAFQEESLLIQRTQRSEIGLFPALNLSKSKMQ